MLITLKQIIASFRHVTVEDDKETHEHLARQIEQRDVAEKELAQITKKKIGQLKQIEK